MLKDVALIPLRPEHQAEAKALILAGLGERWGRINERLNPDLNDIESYHRLGYFVVALCGASIVGTGGLLPVSVDTAHIQRMSVAKELRRQGLGSMILAHLLGIARVRRFESVLLETTDSWSDAISFYESQGFRQVGHTHGEVYFRLRLS